MSAYILYDRLLIFSRTYGIRVDIPALVSSTDVLKYFVDCGKWPILLTDQYSQLLRHSGSPFAFISTMWRVHEKNCIFHIRLLPHIQFTSLGPYIGHNPCRPYYIIFLVWSRAPDPVSRIHILLMGPDPDPRLGPRWARIRIQLNLAWPGEPRSASGSETLL